MDNIREQAVAAVKPHVLEQSVYAGELSITVDKDQLFAVMKTLKEQFGFDYLADIVAIDHYRDEKRFEVQYNLTNLTAMKRLRIKTFVEEDKPELESMVPLWPSAAWNEREAYDMMGVTFRNHPDLRRIYMPEDFEYFPLRKEFPLIGIPGSIQMPGKDAPKGYN